MDVDAIFNGAFFGVLVSVVLCTVNIIQGWTYMNKNSDRWPIRCLVVLLLLFDTTRTAIDVQIVHYYLIDNFGKAAAIQILPVSANVNHILVVVIVFLTQLYFVYRVYLLYHGKLWIPTIIGVSATIALVAGMVSVAGIIRGNNRIEILGETPMRIRVGIGHSFVTLADIITTIAFITKFSTWESNFKRTKTLLQRLVIYTITRGLVVTVVQVVFMVIYEVTSTHFASMGLDFCLSKVYTMTLIAMLNSRSSLRSRLESPIDVTSSAFVRSHLARGSEGALGPVIKLDMDPTINHLLSVHAVIKPPVIHPSHSGRENV